MADRIGGHRPQQHIPQQKPKQQAKPAPASVVPAKPKTNPRQFNQQLIQRVDRQLKGGNITPEQRTELRNKTTRALTPPVVKPAHTAKPVTQARPAQGVKPARPVTPAKPTGVPVKPRQAQFAPTTQQTRFQAAKPVVATQQQAKQLAGFHDQLQQRLAVEGPNKDLQKQLEDVHSRLARTNTQLKQQGKPIVMPKGLQLSTEQLAEKQKRHQEDQNIRQSPYLGTAGMITNRLGTGVIKSVQGTANMVMHPIKTAQDIGGATYALATDRNARQQLVQTAKQTLNDDRAMLEVAGGGLATLVTVGGAFKAVKELKIASKVAPKLKALKPILRRPPVVDVPTLPPGTRAVKPKPIPKPDTPVPTTVARPKPTTAARPKPKPEKPTPTQPTTPAPHGAKPVNQPKPVNPGTNPGTVVDNLPTGNAPKPIPVRRLQQTPKAPDTAKPPVSQAPKAPAPAPKPPVDAPKAPTQAVVPHPHPDVIPDTRPTPIRTNAVSFPDKPEAPSIASKSTKQWNEIGNPFDTEVPNSLKGILKTPGALLDIREKFDLKAFLDLMSKTNDESALINLIRKANDGVSEFRLKSSGKGLQDVVNLDPLKRALQKPEYSSIRQSITMTELHMKRLDDCRKMVENGNLSGAMTESKKLASAWLKSFETPMGRIFADNREITMSFGNTTKSFNLRELMDTHPSAWPDRLNIPKADVPKLQERLIASVMHEYREGIFNFAKDNVMIPLEKDGLLHLLKR